MENLKKKHTKDKQKTKGKSTNKRFAPPTPQAVSEYAKSIGFEVDGEYFVDYYATRGWKIKGSPIKDWKACVRTWKRRAKNDTGSPNDQDDDSPPIKYDEEQLRDLGILANQSAPQEATA